jgi:hypothetical protein
VRYQIRITRNPILRPLLKMFNVSAGNCHVDLDGGRMTVRMGRWFEESVPLEEIAAFGPSEWPAWGGYGIRLAPRNGVGVVASTKGVVHVALKRPQQMNAVIISINAERLWISLEDREGFLAALSGATGLRVSPPVGFWHEASR